MAPRDVIVAPATAHGRAALAVVRVTGTGTREVADRVVRPRRAGEWRHGRARRIDLVDRDGPFDDGVAVWFGGPRSYTGEDLLELSIHGNPELVARTVAAFVDAGARVAHPGEFTRRAVVNGRLDLVHAEGIDQLVRAVGPAGVAVARDAVSGRLSAAVAAVRATLVDLSAEIEARLDFPDDELATASDAAVLERIAALEREVTALADTARAGRIRVDGATVALVGPVNAGKSSLFNALLGEARAIVHPTPGTTRDRVEARARWGSLDVTLVDTAGDRDTDDPVEALGVELARAAVRQADLVVVVLRCRPTGLDPAEARVLAQTADRPRIVVTNAVDLPGQVHPGSMPASARTSAGVDAVRDAVVAALSDVPSDGLAIASTRQRDLLLAVGAALAGARIAWEPAGVAVAADLLAGAIGELDALTGADGRDDVLDALFARFCIGK